MSLHIVFKKLFRIVLMVVFRFEYWHTTPLDRREYAKHIISTLNKQGPCGSVIEIGCGLGDILVNVDFDRRYFYDLSSEVLRAAAFLHKFSCSSSRNSYRVFNFLEDGIDNELKFDCIILVNWIHGIDSNLLKPRLDMIIKNNLEENGLLVFDLIEGNPIYKNNHQMSDIIDEGRFSVDFYSGFDFNRALVFARLK